ncbi:K02A2.6-like [Cordylochernes scorpioides]|uniref:RNA-directed DNA polymerase n=1 Tax=Cordylochernes scorpioides TaxID=51811 RepID=A0ABY6KNR2_9ARAC|nr:K02A2.6-like [Cordylochernes scorpioides]
MSQKIFPTSQLSAYDNHCVHSLRKPHLSTCPFFTKANCPFYMPSNNQTTTTSTYEPVQNAPTQRDNSHTKNLGDHTPLHNSHMTNPHNELDTHTNTQQNPLPHAYYNTTPNTHYTPQFTTLLQRYTHIFSQDKFNVPCLRIPPVKIPTNSEKIITIRPYRVPICDQQEIRNQIQQMLENGIIEQSFSPFSSPVTLVTKRDKTKRFCIDYRKVNELISSDVHPLPRIEDILDRLAQAKYFSTADISSAYWQVPIHPDSRPLLAFATFEGLYQPTRLPFGLKTSPQIYERAISQVLQRHGLDCVAHYFDDFIIYSNTLEEHQNHLRQFFAFCEAEKLQLNFAKCEFFKQSINFLGYTITAGTITPLTRNTDIIHAIKQPHNRKTLQSFLGAVNVYNKFIPEYARLRAPLNNLLKKDVVWNWNEACQEAFIDLKGNLTQHPILHLYKEGLPCQVYCDASTLGIAGILKQVHPDGNVYPVQYFSRTLRPHEKNYSISELECLAIVESVEKFRIYLMGRKFTIFSDHHALQWLKTIKNPSGRLFRWSLRLSSYEYEVRYIKGKLQYEADLLSRNPFCGFLDATLIKTHQSPPSKESSLTIDHNGLHTVSRKVDHFSRYAWAFPSKSTSTTTYQQVLKRVFQDGSPKRLLTDRAPAFTSPKFRSFLLNRNIHPLLTTSNNPQANGLCERLNATLTGKLRLLHLENPKVAWTKLVKKVTLIYNKTPHSTTGFPPIYLMFGILPPEISNHNTPYPDIDKARKIAHTRTQNKHLQDKNTYDQRHKQPHFEVGDLVLVKLYHHPNTGKLAPYFTGPHTILEIISPNVVRIDRPNQPLQRDTDTIHVNKLKLYTEKIHYISPPAVSTYHIKHNPNYTFPFKHLTPELFPTESLRFKPTSSEPFRHLDPAIFATRRFTSLFPDVKNCKPDNQLNHITPPPKDIKQENCEPTNHSNSTIHKTSSQNIFCSLPYNYGCERIARKLKYYNITTRFQSISNLNNILRHPDTKKITEPNNRTNVIYKIPCKSCQAVYIGETGKPLIERINQHKSALKHHNPTSLLVDHALINGHIPDFEQTSIIYQDIKEKHSRLFLESWSSLEDRNSINRKIDIPDIYMVSFDIESLYTSIPHDEAILALQEFLHNHPEIILPIPKEALIDLIELCLALNYFGYKDRYFKQVKGLPMGNPISSALANIYMDRIDKIIADTTQLQVIIWKRYIDDILCITKVDLSTILNFFNNLKPFLKFTFEIEENNSLPFLDIQLTRNQDRIETRIYRKPTHTGSYLNFNSFGPIHHKISVVKTLSKRLITHFSTNNNDTKKERTKIFQELLSNNYPKPFIKKHFYRPRISTTNNRQTSSQNIFCFLPYNYGCERIARKLKYHNITTRFQSISNLNNILRHPDTKKITEPNNRTNVIYKIPCKSCQAVYIGETGKPLIERINQHKSALKHHNPTSLLVDHALINGHIPDFKQTSIVNNCQRQRDPSTFSGDGNINPGQWLKEYERVSKYNRWNETMKLANVVFYLNGTAGRWFDNNEESLNSWRNFEDSFRGVFGLQEDSARRAEEVLKSRAQKAEESNESYIQEILSLCHQVNPRMEEGEIVAHIIKGISEDTYQVLVAKDIQTVDEILKFCRHLTTVKQRRIGRTKFARLSNVMPISCVDDSDDLAGLIRRIVREEIQKVFSAPEVINPLREVNALEQTVREEVSRALQPTRPQVNVVQQQPRTPFYNIDRPTQPRKTEHWRTYDDKPICFHCGRPGHVVRYCRERRQVFAEARSRNGGEGRNVGFSSRPPRYDADDDYVTPQTSTGAASDGGEVAIEENPPGYIAAKLKENFVMVEINGRKIKALVDSGADFSVISDKFRRELKTTLFKEPGPILKAANKNLIETLGKCVLNIEVNGLNISFEFVVMVECSHDIIFGWDFFKATEAVIDCGRNELHVWETSVLESQEEENQRLFASDDFVIPPKSIKKISVMNEEICGVRDVLVSTSKDLLLRKEVLIPNSLVTFRHGRGSIWVANGASWPQLIPSGMNMCTMESYENGNICSLIESSDKLQETQLKSREWSQKINLTLDPGLSEIQRLQLVSCLDEFIGIFDFGSTPIKPTSTVKHKINTGDQSPIKQRPYRVAPSERRLIQDEVNKMIENHIVKPSESPWSSPVILVRKKDGTWRFCVDYRRFNKITKKDVYPLPRIYDALDSLAGSSYFSTMDLRSGYWQIEVDEKDREKTALITPDGLYEFQVMPFGLCNAPATFERMIDSVLGSLKWNMCLCYLDDIVVYAPTFEEHLRRLQLEPQKVSFWIKEDKDFGTPSQEKAFEVLKTALISEPVLAHFDESADTHLHTDASGHGIGAVLLQIQGGKERPIAYASRSLTKAENNYSTTEKECLAVVWSISKFRPYLFGRPFTVVTDHHSLCWLVGQKDPSGRLARWALKLQEFDVTVIYKSGRKHKDADCLSRSPLENDQPSAVMSLTNVDIEQTKDPDLAKIIDNLNSGYTRKEFSIIDGILYKKNYSTTGRPWLMMIPKHLRSEVMADLHDAPTAGHLGFARTYDKCQQRKKLPRRPAGQLVSIPPVEKPFYKVGVDLLGRFPVSKDGNRWIIVCTDYMTRYAITKAIPDGGAIETAKFLVEDVILKHGAPREMITDRGRNFISQVIKEINALCGIVHRFTTAYHPQTNSLTERFNKTLGDMLSMYTGVEQKDWDQVLPYVTFAYNTAKQEATGYTPFFLVHAREAETYIDAVLPYLPDEISNDYVGELVTRAEEARQLSRSRLLQSQAKDRRLYDQKHTPVYYQKNDLVWVFTPIRKVGLSEKLLKRYFGPYKVTKKLSEVTYEVEPVDPSPRSRKAKDIVHVIRMKPYLDPEEQHSILLGNTSRDRFPSRTRAETS